MNKDTQLTYFLILMAMVSPVALNIVAPIMPILAKEFGASNSVIQLSFTAYLATLAIGQLFGGPLADRYGKRNLLLWGFGLHVAGGLVGVFASSVELILLSRVMQAAGGCIGMMLARSILVDMYPSEKAVEKLSYVTMGVAVSQAIAPTVGGVVSEFIGWHSVFYLPMLMATAVWVGVFFQYPKPISDEMSLGKTTSFIGTYKKLVQNQAYISLTLSSTLIACGFFSFVTCAPFIVSATLGESLTQYGFWFLFVAFGFMVGSFTSAQLSTRLSHSSSVIIGHSLSLIGGLLMLVSFTLFDISYENLFLTMALFTFGRGLSQPHLQSLSIASVEENRASASGLLGFIQLLLGALLAQLVGALVEQIGSIMLPLFLVGYGVCALALYFHYHQNDITRIQVT
ncbi:multidrug effflux MFS transporter [Vibrio sp. DW001]|uniref:multidrug effflux MFS transporter n=1 Tax=Vibrio sp. DW001 TaxID=2912315 RepID=UPI0023AEEA94|nr:multidrug effflux MFS transporter [Vibrio sp. DW001]WED29803.1 multidrug effflux MFS transporter [Vibrio sp. DW001]